MIISNIIGGLGNQMFQYACGRAVSLRSNQSFRIITDQFKEYILHNGYELERVFQLPVKLATKSELNALLGWQKSPKFRHLFGRPSLCWATGQNWCNEPFFSYWSGIRNVQRAVYMHGYWQSERYFNDVADVIRQDFTFSMPWDDIDQAVLKRMRSAESVSIHIRRGDYTQGKNQKIFALCGIEYYRDAIRYLRQRFPDISLFVFSDNPDWVDAELKSEFGKIETVRHNIGDRSANDMRLMSQADHHIIANSSFSWWGAWLNPSPEKIVIAPRQWFLNGTVDKDLVPSSWVRL